MPRVHQSNQGTPRESPTPQCVQLYYCKYYMYSLGSTALESTSTPGTVVLLRVHGCSTSSSEYGAKCSRLQSYSSTAGYY